ncbi:MAG: double-strand break repair helicase AddA [Rhodospirillaceae bacterium]|nr:double-strand break repair helicase AddA [Rhodospirillaceae bacterium]
MARRRGRRPMSRKPALTAAQVVAADPTQPVWVSANAGTGKTHVLIERILRLLLAATPPGKILCLTYTKAAAAEVATRLSTRLGHWAAGGDKALARDLKKLLGKPASTMETERARTLFAATLETPEGLRIRTIHSFSESLLGRFPVEARLAPHFSVLDERRAREIRIEARDRLLAGGAAAGPAGEALSRLAGMLNAEDFSKLMAELDKKRQKLRQGTARAGGLEGLIAETRRGLGLKPDDTRDMVLDAAAEGAFDREALTNAANALDEGKQSDKDRAAQIRDWLEKEAPARAEIFASAYAPVFLTQDGKPRKSLMTKKPREAHPKALDALEVEQDRVAAVLDRLKAVALAEATAALLVVGMALIDAYEAIKKTRALLDYDDLIEKAGRLLASGDGVSWVHYKLDGGIDHILVDEAQDTSPAQWQVIKRLAGDFYAGEGAGEGERPLARTVFAVGDEKQSIYSFQDADPAYFGLMRDHFRATVANAGGRLQEVELERSYRSAPAVLSVVDDIFASETAADGLTWDDKPIHHHTNRDGQGGVVELWPALSPEDAPAPKPWDAPLDQMSAQSPEARLIEKIADGIAGWLESGEILESAARPITPGDIMILVRTRGSFADRMVRALKRRGIGVTGRDRLKLMDHLAVMDLVASGRFALLPDDDLNTAAVLKGPFVEFDDDVLFGLAHGRKGTLWRTLGKRRDEKPEFISARETLGRLLAAADRTPPYEFYARLLGPGGGRRDLIAHLGPEAGEPIDEFLGLALDFERDHQPSLEGFLHWLESGETEVKREMESGRDEVRVLTVHGAKGLEAPIVFLPDTCTLPGERMDPHIHWAGNGDGAGDGGDEFVLWRPSKRDEEKISADLHEKARLRIEREYRRLLYVAMTRARDRLYVCGWHTGKNRKDGCWYDLVEPAMQKKGEEATLETGETVWRHQSPQKAKPDGEKTPSPAPDTEAPPDWALAPPRPEPEPSRPLAPSRPSDDDPSVISPLGPDGGDDGGARFKRGLLIHRLLQSLPDLAPGERQAQGRAYLSRPVHDLGPGEQDEILAETLGVLTHPDHAGLFGPGSLAEVPITGIVGGKDGVHVLSGQVDRLLVTEEAVSVIDFKTNRPPPETESDVDPRYLRQMAAYRNALREIYPGRPVRAVLLWTLGPRLMSLSDAILDASAP